MANPVDAAGFDDFQVKDPDQGPTLQPAEKKPPQSCKRLRRLKSRTT
jgi:hypothetical protein